MGVTWLLIALAIVLVLCLMLARYTALSVRHVLPDLGVDVPPGSRLIGHFWDGIKYGIFDGQKRFYNMFKDKKMYGLIEFKTPVIVIRDLDLIKDVCVKHFNSFTDRRVIVNLGPPFDHNLLAIFGEQWKRVRSAVSPTFSSGRLKKMCRHVERNARSLQRVLDQKQESNEKIELKDIMSRVTMDTVASTGFGLDTDLLGQTDSEFFKHAQAFINPNVSVLIVNFMFPFLGKLLEKVGICFISPKAEEFFEKVVDAALQERRQSENAGKMHDFLDLMINAEEKEKMGENSEEIAHGGLTRNEIFAQALVFLLAGYDTVSAVLSFTLFMLAVHPEHQRLVQEELDSKLSDSNDEGTVPNYETVQNLPYLDQCINETMRLYPPGFILDRVCTEEITLEGVKIPKDMPIILPVYAIHTDPDIWEDPLEFKPERFSPELRDARHQFSFLPFGHGPRNCIGMRLGQLELKILLASVLSRFDVLPCEKTVYPVKLISWQLAAKDGLWVKLERRPKK